MPKKKAKATVYTEGMDTESVVAQLNKKYGENSLIVARKARGMLVRFFSTGCYALDFGMGGGIPENRITEFRGPYSSLKSTLSLLSAANFQRKYDDGVVFFVDMERTFDPDYADCLGVDLDRIIIVNPDSGEQAGDLIKEVLNYDKPTYVIIDSIAAMTPTAEIEGSMDNQMMGVQARMINRIMRTAVSALKRSMYDPDTPTVTILCINQIREKIGVMFGNPETAPGGKGKEFAYSVMVRVSSTKSDAIIEKVVQNGITRQIRYGQTLKFDVTKNKVSRSQFDSGEVNFYSRSYKHFKANSFDNVTILFNYGVFYGIIETESDNTKVYEDISFKDASRFKKALNKKPSLMSCLYNDIQVSMNTDAGVGEDEEDDEDEDEEEEETQTPRKNDKKKSLTRKKKV